MTFSSMDMYQFWRWVIRPACKPDHCSYAELVALDQKAQTPKWFLAHCWKDCVVGLANCMEAHLHVRNLPGDTMFWVCAFASSHRDLEKNKCGELAYMPVFRALHSCDGILLVLDEAGNFFRRIWCCFECTVLVEDAWDKQLLCDIAIDVKGHAHVLTD